MIATVNEAPVEEWVFGVVYFPRHLDFPSTLVTCPNGSAGDLDCLDISTTSPGHSTLG